MITTEQKNRAHQDADYIFKELFPQCGMKERQGQTGLCHEMLDAMFGGKIMLSDAGTGIGKTYAYLTAAVIFHKYRMEAGESWQPIAISTASVALQEAIHREYIPMFFLLYHIKRMEHQALLTPEQGLMLSARVRENYSI